jgi:hypothetical protein
MKTLFPKLNPKDSLFSYVKANPLGCIDRFSVKPHIKWHSYEQIQENYHFIIADPLKEKEPEPYKYIIIFDPQTLDKCTYDAEDIEELKRKHIEQFGNNLEIHNEFNLVEFTKNILLKINITFNDINKLRQYLPNNSYSKELKRKKLIKINEDLLYSVYLLRFKPNFKDNFKRDFQLLNRAFNTKLPPTNFFRKVAEDVFIDFNIEAFIRLLPLTAKDINIHQFYTVLSQKIYPELYIHPSEEEQLQIKIDEDDIVGRIEYIIDKYAYDIRKKTFLALQRRNRLRIRKHVAPPKGYHWLNVDPLIKQILSDFEYYFVKLYKKYHYLNVNPNYAFSKFISDVLTEERLNILLPGVDHDAFKRLLIRNYVNRFYLPNLRRYFTLVNKYKTLRYQEAIEELLSDLSLDEKPRDLSVKLLPPEALEDLLIDFRIKYEEIKYIIDGLRVQPNEKYTDSIELIEENYDILEKLLENPYEDINELEFFKVTSENGHLNPIIEEFDYSSSSYPDDDDDDDGNDDNERKSNEEEEKEKTERTTGYVKSIGEFVAIHIITKPPLTSEICNTSIKVPDNKKIRIYKIYVGFVRYDEKNKRHEHLFTRPITINFLVETVDSFTKGLQKEVYATTAQIEDLREVISVSTYVYYVGNQELVDEFVRRSLVNLSKKIGYHWLGIGSGRVVTGKKAKVFIYFTIIISVTAILNNIWLFSSFNLV